MAEGKVDGPTVSIRRMDCPCRVWRRKRILCRHMHAVFREVGHPKSISTLNLNHHSLICNSFAILIYTLSLPASIFRLMAAGMRSRKVIKIVPFISLISFKVSFTLLQPFLYSKYHSSAPPPHTIPVHNIILYSMTLFLIYFLVYNFNLNWI